MYSSSEFHLSQFGLLENESLRAALTPSFTMNREQLRLFPDNSGHGRKRRRASDSLKTLHLLQHTVLFHFSVPHVLSLLIPLESPHEGVVESWKSWNSHQIAL